MKANWKLINALRKAADRIETRPGDYNWYDSSSCNCGILAQELLGKRVAIFGTWHRIARGQRECEATGLPMQEVFSALKAIGFEWSDYIELEWLGGAAAERAGIATSYSPYIGPHGCTVAVDELFKHPPTVVRYFRAQADILEEQLAEQFETRELKPISPKPVEAGV